MKMQDGTYRFWPKIVTLLNFMVLLLLLVNCTVRSDKSPQASVSQNTTVPGELSEAGIGSVSAGYRTVSSIKELADIADVIVIGRATATDETVNMARDENDLARPDPNVLVVGRSYEVRVSRYLKGNGADVIYVLLREAFLGARAPKTEENIAQARRQFVQIPIDPEKQYVFFLAPRPEFGEAYFTGPTEPWRFDISDVTQVKPESPWHYASTVFPSPSLDEMIEQLGQ